MSSAAITAIAGIAAETLITAHAVVHRPLLLVGDGRILRVTTRDEAPQPEGTLDLQGCTLTAGFLDIHVHGAGGRDVMEAAPGAVDGVAEMLARHGTSSFLATTVTAPVDTTLRALERMADAVETQPASGRAKPIGIHIEGPFLSHAKRGVHPEQQLQAPSVALFDRFYDAARGHIRLMTVAPELPGAPEMMAHAAARGMRLSVGHSNALAAEARAGIAAVRGGGANHSTTAPVSATHTFNAMRALDHREPGILGVVLDDQALYAELICDGVHVLPELVRLWLRCKGPERAVLVTDGMAATGMPDGQYKLGELDVQVRDGVCISGGVLAGSVLTMDRAVANLRRFTGTDLATAVRLATRNPAALLGLTDGTGDVQPGAEANLNIFAPDGTFRGSILRGAHLPRS